MQALFQAVSGRSTWPLDGHPLSHASRHGLLNQVKAKLKIIF